MLDHAVRESRLHTVGVRFEIESQPRGVLARGRRRTAAPGGRESRRERGSAFAAERHGPCVRDRAARRRTLRGDRRRARHPRRRRGARLRTLLPRRLGALVARRRRRTRPRNRALDRRAPRRRHPCRAGNEPHGCRMVATHPRTRRGPEPPPTPELRSPAHHRRTVTSVSLDLHRRRVAADPPGRDGARGRRRGPRERGRPHARGRVGDARGDQLHVALGARARVHAVRRGRGSTSSTSGRWCLPAPPVATPRSPCRSTTATRAAASAHTIARSRSAGSSSPMSRPDDFIRPGHVFPLRAREGGVLERRGHTEAAVDLARLAGLRARRGDLRGAARRRFTGAASRTSSCSRRSTASR